MTKSKPKVNEPLTSNSRSTLRSDSDTSLNSNSNISHDSRLNNNSIFNYEDEEDNENTDPHLRKDYKGPFDTKAKSELDDQYSDNNNVYIRREMAAETETSNTTSMSTGYVQGLYILKTIVIFR